jgi:hypothetical protein
MKIRISLLKKILRIMNGILESVLSNTGHSIDNKLLKYFRLIILYLTKTIRLSSNIRNRFTEI